MVSPDLFLDLQRLQPNTGLLEIDRIKKLIGDNVRDMQRHGSRQGRARVRRARVPGSCHRPPDLSVGYLELADFKLHVPYHIETAALRVKDPAAIVGIRVTPSASIKHLRAACI